MSEKWPDVCMMKTCRGRAIPALYRWTHTTGMIATMCKSCAEREGYQWSKRGWTFEQINATTAGNKTIKGRT